MSLILLSAYAKEYSNNSLVYFYESFVSIQVKLNVYELYQYFLAICSLLLCAWEASSRWGNASRLNKLVEKACSITELSLDTLETEVGRRSLQPSTTQADTAIKYI